MFRDDTQRAKVCNALTFWIRGRGLWQVDPPAPLREAQTLLRTGISSSEATVLRFAWSCWNNSSHAKFDGRDLHGLDDERMRLVGSLFVAMASGERAISAWLDARQPRQCVCGASSWPHTGNGDGCGPVYGPTPSGYLVRETGG
jgi:hypothetical protein